MALRITAEERQEIKDEFINENQSTIGHYSTILAEYCQTKTLVKDTTIISKIFPSYDKMDSIAGNILFILATMENGEKPLQSVAGQISGMLSASDNYSDRTDAMHTAMEILTISAPYAVFTYSRNGHPMIATMISDPDLISKNIHLPLERPTEQNETLGSFDWQLSNDIPAMFKLNHIGLRVRLLQEPDEEIPNEHDFSKDAVKQRELCNKQLGRRFLSEKYNGKKIFFNWSADYRVRMYSVGYYLNPQGNEVEKNMIELYKGEKLTFKGIQRLKKSIASAYGLDKKTELQQTQWFMKNQKMLHLRVRNAKEPYTFQSLVRAWKEHLKGETVHTMIELDSTQSQAQILAVLLHSKEIAETCNVIPSYDNGTLVQKDLYQLVADRMSDIIAEQQIAA